MPRRKCVFDLTFSLDQSPDHNIQRDHEMLKKNGDFRISFGLVQNRFEVRCVFSFFIQVPPISRTKNICLDREK